MRPAHFQNEGFYHLYNRGVDKRRIFLRRGHYIRFIRTIRNILDTGSATPRLKVNQSAALKLKVSIVCYCLMPNHYHFLIKQLSDNGITEIMHKLDTSYTKYINLNLKRVGHLFEYRFKAKTIDNDETFVHVGRYIHLNPLLGNVTHNLDTYEWSSYLDYVGKRNGTICQKSEMLSFFDNDSQKYAEFTNNQTEYAKLIKQSQEIPDNEDALYI